MTSRLVKAFAVRCKRESPKLRTDVGLRKVFVGGIKYRALIYFLSLIVENLLLFAGYCHKG